jgi:hypothetical protein
MFKIYLEVAIQRLELSLFLPLINYAIRKLASLISVPVFTLCQFWRREVAVSLKPVDNPVIKSMLPVD